MDPDLILLDLVMPVMDGTAFLKRLREDAQRSELPVIICTGKELSLKERKRLLAEATRVLEKGDEFEADLASALADFFPLEQQDGVGPDGGRVD